MSEKKELVTLDQALDKVKGTIYAGSVGALIKKEYSDVADIKLIKEMTAPDVTWPYFKTFLQTAIRLRLDPMRKQIWCYHVDKNKAPVIFAGIHGIMAIAQRHASFDGVEVEHVKTDKGDLVIARAWRKDRRLPSEQYARDWRDDKKQAAWKANPELMLEKVAKVRALREAYPEDLSDVYTEEEMPERKTVDAVISAPSAPETPLMATAADYRIRARVFIKDGDKATALADATALGKQLFNKYERTADEVKNLDEAGFNELVNGLSIVDDEAPESPSLDETETQECEADTEPAVDDDPTEDDWFDIVTKYRPDSPGKTRKSYAKKLFAEYPGISHSDIAEIGAEYFDALIAEVTASKKEVK